MRKLKKWPTMQKKLKKIKVPKNAVELHSKSEVPSIKTKKCIQSFYFKQYNFTTTSVHFYWFLLVEYVQFSKQCGKQDKDIGDLNLDLKLYKSNKNGGNNWLLKLQLSENDMTRIDLDPLWIEQICWSNLELYFWVLVGSVKVWLMPKSPSKNATRLLYKLKENSFK